MRVVNDGKGCGFTVAVFGVNPMIRLANKSRDGRFALSVDVRAAP